MGENSVRANSRNTMWNDELTSNGGNTIVNDACTQQWELGYIQMHIVQQIQFKLWDNKVCLDLVFILALHYSISHFSVGPISVSPYIHNGASHAETWNCYADLVYTVPMCGIVLESLYPGCVGLLFLALLLLSSLGFLIQYEQHPV